MNRVQLALHRYYSTYHREGGDTTPSDSSCENSPVLLCRLLKGTVVYKIWYQCVLMILYTVVLVCLHNYVDGLQMSFPLSLVPVLGVVTGLLLVFRTNTAYERYWEGRKIWSTMTYHLRSLTLLIWLGVDDQEMSKNVSQDNRECTTEEMIEKVSALNLLVAFAFSTKNYLRGEYSYDEEDMKELISHLPKFWTPSSNKPLSAQGPSFKRRKSCHRSPPVNGGAAIEEETLSDVLNESQTSINENKQESTAGINNDTGDSSKRKGCPSRRPPPGPVSYRIAYDYITPSNIPIEVVYYLFSYMKAVASRGQCEPNVIRNMQTSMLSLIDCLTSFERILRTPMPMGYSVHLYYTVWIYLLALPYQLVATLNWWTIAAVAIASFALLGILAIGGEIENPFGYDENDLPLDDFCSVIRREIQVIMGHAVPSLKSWVMSKDNHPFAPTSWLSAQELSTLSREDLREILERGAVQDMPDFIDGGSTNL